MTFTVEVLLKGQQDAVAEEVQHDMLDPSSWADDDVREVLQLTLRQFDRVQNPEAEEREVQFRGLSWIVTTGEQGVAITIESASAAIFAGPFGVDADWLTAAITRVIAGAAPTATGGRVH